MTGRLGGYHLLLYEAMLYRLHWAFIELMETITSTGGFFGCLIDVRLDERLPGVYDIEARLRLLRLR